MRTILRATRVAAFSAFLLLLWLMASVPTYAQSTSPGFDSVYNVQLRQRLASLGSAGGFKGLSAAVIIPGQGIWVSAWGNAAPNTPLTPAMKMGIGSNSKAFSAVLLLKLQEEGLLDLDDPLSEYLPPTPNVSGNVTLRQMLQHRSGLFDYLNDVTAQTQSVWDNYPDSAWTMPALLSTIGAPFFAPGQGYSYSNTNYLLAGIVGENASGSNIHQLFHSRIFDPLGLSATKYPLGDNVFSGPWCNLYNTSGTGITLDPDHEESFLSVPATAGGIWSTPYDMVRWYSTLFGSNWLNPASARQLRDADGFAPYGLGVRLQNNYDRSYYYHGGVWGFRSYMLHDPASGITLCIISNQYGKSVNTVAASMFQEIMNKLPKKAIDLQLVSIDQPEGYRCVAEPARVTLKNKGFLPLTNLKVWHAYDGAAWADSFLIALPSSLAAGAETELSLNLPSPAADGQKHRLRVRVEPVALEGYPRDNVAICEVLMPTNAGKPLPYFEGFETPVDLPADWVSMQPEDLLDWERSIFAAKSGSGSLARNNYWDGNNGRSYYVQLPLLNLQGYGSAALSFAYAYAPNPDFDNEFLRGQISTDCGNTFEPLFEIPFAEMGTAPASGSAYAPKNNEWGSKVVDLSAWANQSVLIRLEMVNDYGNVFFLDNVRVDGVVPTESPVAATSLEVSPNPARSAFQLRWQGIEASPAQLFLYNMQGQLVKTVELQASGVQEIQRDGLPGGIYWMKIQDATQVFATGKVIFVD